jgi:hypothetical protein
MYVRPNTLIAFRTDLGRILKPMEPVAMSQAGTHPIHTESDDAQYVNREHCDIQQCVYHNYADTHCPSPA